MYFYTKITPPNSNAQKKFFNQLKKSRLINGACIFY